MKRLFLDDYRNPIDCCTYMYNRGIDLTIYHQEWVIVRSYGEFISWITTNGLPEIISFDHDLADVQELCRTLPINDWYNKKEHREYTGMDCAHWVINHCMDNDLTLPRYIVHSQNPAGKENIQKLLDGYNYSS